MQIKRLNIFGFKSFAERMSLSFPSGITTIVGPNGCGKSNIVDAIRWVLGEQSVKSLRGKSMEDVIFNGSEKRRPLGIAEVSLTFSNENGSTLQGFDQYPEISIKRRVYRSGESDYFINNSPCRLKDIVELFMDTGVGTRAYSIIEQGCIEWLVNSKPEDRRSMIEEAAGIHKYKSRKDEALRKLEATEMNLLRVKDIIKEIQGQINSLQYQAGKARRYKSLGMKIKDLELSLWADEYNQIYIRKEALEKELEALNDKEVGLSTCLSQKEKNQEEIKMAALKKGEELKENQEKVIDAERTIQKIEGEIELSQLKLRKLKEERTSLKMETKELREKKEKLKRERASLRESMTSLIKRIENKEEDLKMKECSLNNLQDLLSPEDSCFEVKKKAIVDLVTDLTTRKNTISYLVRSIEELRGRLDKNCREKEEVNALLSNIEMNIREFSKKWSESRKKRGMLKSRLKERLLNVDRLKKDFLEKKKDSNILKDEITRESSRLYSLIELDKNMEGFDRAVRSVIKSVRGGKTMGTGIHGLVADIIETQPRYERAVEAALGERLQYVIVESQRDGVEAIQYLKSADSGRGGFIPLKVQDREDRKVDKTLPAKAKARLLDCVKVKKGYDTIANYLFGDILLVEDIGSAIDIWRKNGLEKTLVTLDGDILDPWGVLLGGSHNGKDTGILKRKREIKGLNSLVEGLKKREVRLEGEVSKLSKEMSEAERDIEVLREENHKIEIDEIEKENNYKRLKGEKTFLENRQELLALEGEEFSRDLKDISSRRKNTVREKEEIEARLSHEESSLILLEEKFKELRKEREVSLKKLTELKVDLASWREKREAFHNASLKADEQIVDIEEKLSSSRERIIKCEEEEERLLSLIDRLKVALETALRDKEKIGVEKVKKEEGYQVFLEKIRGIDEEIGRDRRELSAYQKDLSDRQLILKELELNLLHLKEKVKERYTEDLDSYASLKRMDDMPREESQERLDLLKKRLISLGEVNLAAQEELEKLKERYNFLTSQQDDLNRSIEGLHKAIGKINRISKKKFKHTFDTINKKFQEVYTRLFEGGKAELRLTDESNLLECGIDIVAQPKGKRLQSITLLSGGEKALTALSLIFSIFLIKPSPFCILDEADAPLDDTNILKFNSMVKELAKDSQFILITHNKKTMEIAETLFGITMEESGVSRLLSVKMQEADNRSN